MTKEEKLSAIYKEMANKKLTFGCLVKTSEDKIEMICSGLVNEGTSFATISYPEGRWCGFTTIYNLRDSEWINLDSKKTIKEIIGHPIMIGDVMYYIRKKYWNNYSWFHSDRKKLIDLRYKEREPIEGQYYECINYVYSLFKS